MKLIGKDLTNSAFSTERIILWGVGVIMLVGMVTMAILAYQKKPIAPQLQSATMICIGAFVARIERKK